MNVGINSNMSKSVYQHYNNGWIQFQSKPIDTKTLSINNALGALSTLKSGIG
jgi:hypothetical protein